MTTLNDAPAPDGGAGWYQDPLGSGNDRYWDGTVWTHRIQKGANPRPDPSIAGAPVVPPDEASRETGVSGWVRRRPRTIFWSTLGIALIVGLAIGGAAASDKSEVNEKNDEISSLQRQLANSEETQEGAEAEAARISARKGQIIAGARSKAASIVGSSKSETDEAKASLASLKGEVESTESELEGVESSLGGVEEEKALSTIPGDGTFKAEVDYLPGTYRAPGGPGCYWATLNSADPYDIASNENASGPTIASIESPYFQTEGCGKWERISE
jgi:Protein of unknown function (DUF2510)